MASCNDCIHRELCNVHGYVDADECGVYKNKADFVEVVRCKDCKHRYFYDEFDRNRQKIYKCTFCGILHKGVDDNAFCSYGERKDAK